MSAKSTEKYPLVEAGEVELKVGAAYQAIADGGKTGDGKAITEVITKRGYVFRIVAARDDVARDLGFGKAE